ncbi:MAG: sigma-54-dependent Fis family transcriptional regulator [Acidobacteria bacterium]|nr:sigma-54-dependent Fis family transcriptional regulator [Acidobacteriota bacterium]MBI3488882.1 sigma-54-dependent Fis family transcriptional regulator [Acidobacteriota bacterium]
MTPSILIVDDNEKLCGILAQDFERAGYRCRFALQGPRALELVRSGRTDVILLDLRLGRENGLDVLQELRRIDASIPVVMATAYASIENAVEAIKRGAFDYVQKPAPFPALLRVVERALMGGKGSGGVRPGGAFITRNARTLDCLDRMEKLAQTEHPVFITGESGTGKDLLAEFIHLRSPRAAAPLCRINCASLPASLLDNELFGHDRGAYTGADGAFPGIFERAGGGSLFLDEIGDMSLEIQAKILRTLQNKEVRRLGGRATLRVDVRFIAATNKDIAAMVREGRFREDLYYRLSTAVFAVPPLRERLEDIPVLVAHFLAEDAAANVDVAAMQILLAHAWPGNVRELKNALDYARAMAPGGTIGVADLPAYLHPPGFRLGGPGSPDEREKQVILDALRRAGNNRSQAAELLNMSRRTLYNKLAKHGIA